MEEKGDSLVLERSQEVQNDEVKLNSLQYKALMTLLQQQQNSAHVNSHVNQIGIVTGFVGSSNIHVGSTPLFSYQKNLQDQKKNRKHSKATSKSLHHEFTWFDNVPTSTGNAAHHHHIDHETLQVQYKQQLA